MAARIKITDLNNDQYRRIREYLFIQPIETFNVHGRNYNYTNNEAKEAVPFYSLLEINGDNYIDLPLAFASTLIGKVMNRDLNHLKIKMGFNETMGLYDHQKEVSETALEKLQQYGGIHLGLYPGFGKTVVSAWLSSKVGYLTLVLSHRTGLIKQWSNTYSKFTNAKIWTVGENFPQVTNNEYIDVILCMNTRFHHIPKELIDAIGTVIVDESHNFCTAGNVGALLGTRPRYFISCSATLKRPDGMDKMINFVVGNNSITKHSSKPFKYYEVRTGLKIQTFNNAQNKTDFTKYVRDLSSHELRNRLILQLVSSLKDSKILILTARTDHAKYIHQCLSLYGENVDIMVGSKNSYQDSRVLIGTYSKIGEGFDEASVCDNYNGVRLDTLINCSTFKSETILEQTSGRVFRAKFPNIYDLVDDMPISKRHFAVRKKWYLSRNGTPHLINANLSSLHLHIEHLPPLPPYPEYKPVSKSTPASNTHYHRPSF